MHASASVERASSPPTVAIYSYSLEFLSYVPTNFGYFLVWLFLFNKSLVSTPKKFNILVTIMHTQLVVWIISSLARFFKFSVHLKSSY